MKNVVHNKIQFLPVSILKHGILYQDGHMVYTDVRGHWLYVSEDGARVYMYNNVSDLIRELYKHDDDDDFVITGWDFYPVRFTYLIDSAYNYYVARYDE